MATKNIEKFAIPVESNYDTQDAYEYYANEREFDGTKIPEEELSKSTRESIDRVKAREVKLGARGMQAAMFSDAA